MNLMDNSSRNQLIIQGGGGEKLKAKQRALEDAQKANAAKGGGPTVDLFSKELDLIYFSKL